MKPSTLCELVGFGMLAYAAWMLAPVAGVAVGGFCLLLIGYATEDAQVTVAIHRIVDPLRLRWVALKARRISARGLSKKAS